ncbi:peptidoglycan DD-metalloendopeptidase family protein [Duganella callida]|uniref:Peptidase n=1 Tax=Duganella callida TaxID=2561932 RepID=A0A4Y9S873_9BURK|nr:peptidoglycan DD-metalloendopeptidase family protein [Duganella callida]TFW16680.1 peptidase [Duganella callida]
MMPLAPWAMPLAAKWLLACAGSLAAGLLVWLLLHGVVRMWPALRTSRKLWLAAQGTVAIAALLPLLPVATHSSGSAAAAASTASFAPAFDSNEHRATVSDAVSDADAGRAPATAAVSDTGAATQQGRRPGGSAWPRIVSSLVALAAGVWLPVYGIGLTGVMWRRLRARRLWRDLLAGARPLTEAELRAHAGFTPAQRRRISRRGLRVLRTDAAVSPMLIGVRRPVLLLPAHLDALSEAQQQMIVAHELHHWRVRDPLWLAVAATLQTVFWFNAPLRWMARQMEWALELQCDQQVLAGRPQQERKQYALSLLRQWTVMAPAAAAAFGGATVAARIRQMQHDGLPMPSIAAGCTAALVLTLVLAAGVALQPALAFSVPPVTAAPASSSAPALAANPLPSLAPAAVSMASEATAAPAAASAAEPWRLPLAQVRVTGFFGVMRSVLPTPHKGIDFAAAKGTPAYATADGIITAAGPIAENDGRYGTAVIIDHGAQSSLYAHLDGVSVQPGQRVHAGQLIGRTGASGFATGPHLHFEVRRNGRIVDPAPLFANLDAHATPRALKARRQQPPTKD